MSSLYLQTDLKKETKNFEAFDRLTTALTRIDEFQVSKNKRLLEEAAEFISKALEADNKYFKAQYFQAVVNYLQGKHTALDDFKKLLKSDSPPEVKNEINYNIAVINAAQGEVDSAIAGFDEVTKGPADPEIKLLARAGLALTCRWRIDKRGSYETKEGQKSDPEIIKEQDQEIRNTVASEEEGLITDEVVTEVERIMSEALEEDVKLRRPRRRKRLSALIRRLRKPILLIIGSIIVVLFILWLYLYVGFNDFSGF
jgi:tetratricopeptide (TPR) repeat protein